VYVAAWGDNLGVLKISSSTNQGQSWDSARDIASTNPLCTSSATMGGSFVVGYVNGNTSTSHIAYIADPSNIPGPVVVAFTGTATTVTPSIAVVSNSSNYMAVWTEGTGGYYPYTGYEGYAISSADGITWSGPTLISASSNIDNTAISVGGNSSGFLAVWKDTTGACITEYCSSTTWSGTLVTARPSGTLAGGVKPAVCGVGSTDFMVAYVDTSYNAYALYSTNNGTSWAGPYLIATGISSSSAGLNMSSVADGFVVSWQNSSNIAQASFSSNSGVTWSSPVNISGSLDTDSGVGVAGVDSNTMFTWFNNSGDAFSSFSIASSSTAQSPISQGGFKSVSGNRPGNPGL
jgi:hypothetical protein